MDGATSAELIAQILEEWNKAEKAIKIAEQVNGEIINPAVYELRYAGRRFVEAVDHINKGTNDKALKLLHDAHFDCCRARHDAIDAATSKISADLKIAVRKIGSSFVLDKFPNYISLIGELSAVRGLIAISREDRDNRDKIYATVESDNLQTIIKYYNEFQASEPILRNAGKWSRVKTVFGFVGWLVAAGISIASLFKK